MASTAPADLPDGLYAAFDTSMGGFTCRLEYVEAPLTCANFVGLAEGTQAWADPRRPGSVVATPLYDESIFHRVIDDFMIQGGDPLGTGMGGPGYYFPDEFSPSLRHDAAGTLSMANSGPDSNGSQFFVTLANTPWLDDHHSVFGEVVDGMDVVSAIGGVATDANDAPLTPVVIDRIVILRRGLSAEAFDPSDYPLPEISVLSASLTNETGNLSLLAPFSNQCETLLYDSPDLSDWNFFTNRFDKTTGGVWRVEDRTNRTNAFFRGIRARLPQSTTNAFAGKYFRLSIGNDFWDLAPEGNGGGFSRHWYPTAGDWGFVDGVISNWQDNANHYGFFILTDLMKPHSIDFHYSNPQGGTYEGFYWGNDPQVGGFRWIPTSGVFTNLTQ